ncbi:peroxiredoxin [uncultured Moraxella sp.]|uniref:peroxiredoxin n=1 Tax=uncultured Moraxella sp. TaxID=263769 RepID=UPI0025F14CE9|nr:peroxiredoxin [uncultured Moraxella sp.]
MLKNTQEQIALPTDDFELVTPSGEVVSVNLSTLIKDGNQGLVLYFYPKDSTAGCTVQATDFTANFDEITKLGYRVIGVSRDGVKSHQNFINKQSLAIELISDTDEHLCQHFDVIKEKMMYGKTHLGVVRSTFVYDKNGVMIGSFRNVKAKEHVANLLEFLKN